MPSLAVVVQAIEEAEGQLAQLVEKALAGEEMVLSRAGEPVLRLSRLSGAPGERTTAPDESVGKQAWLEPGAMKGEIWIADDFDEFGPELAELFGIDPD